MKCIRRIIIWQKIRKKLLDTLTIGFVPTMGFLHQGHAALIERARNENDIVILSIFVNPTQFSNKEDYKAYPKCLDKDLTLAASLGVDYVLVPDAQDMYPKGSLCFIETDHPLANVFEGEHRPGHFTGVLTVVMKLLQLVQPTRAYFGEKDYQQFVLIQAMVDDFFMSVDIKACSTVREPSGLPFSSRNSRLTESEKALAECTSALLRQTTLENIAKINTKLKRLGITVEYLDCYHNRIFSALRIGEIRLIDNFTLEAAT